MLRVASVLAVFVVVLVCAVPAFAQPEGEGAGSGGVGAGGGSSQPLITFSGALGAGLVTIGAAYGIGKLASSALESMARQPEVAGTIQIAMIIAAALIEGFTFFALYICMINVGKM